MSESPKSVKTFLELFKSYWGYFMTLLAAVTFIWTLGVKSEKKNIEKGSLQKDVIQIKETQKVQGKNIDSLLNIVTDVKESQVEVLDNQNALRNSYVKYVVNDKSLTTKQFLEYMEGLEFQLQPLKSVVDTTGKNYKISVKKKDE
jgi:hypothetical protein